MVFIYDICGMTRFVLVRSVLRAIDGWDEKAAKRVVQRVLYIIGNLIIRFSNNVS